MSILRSMFSPMAAGGGQDSVPFDIMTGHQLARKTTSGELVSPARALALSTYYACVRNIAEDIGKLPFKVYRRISGGGKEEATDHQLYRLLHDMPNPETTSQTFRETMNGWAESWGNAYAEIQRDRSGNPIALWPIHPDNCNKLRRVDGELFLDVYVKGTGSVSIPYDDVFHIRGFGDDPLCGLSVVGLAAESLGVSLAAQTFGAAFFGNGAIPAIVLTHPGKLSETAQTNMRESWKKRHSGARNSNGVAVLQEGVKVETLSIAPDDAQFLETREFQVSEIARWFRMQPHKIGDMKASTNNNIEQQAIEYVVDTLMPWGVRWEQEVRRKLMTERERRELVAEILFDALLRGDSTARGNFYRVLFQMGALSPDEIRALENRNPIPGGLGKKYYMQGAMMTLEQINEGKDKPASAANEPDPSKAATETEPAK